MSKSIKTLLTSALIILGNFSANFLIFTYSYNRLATPYLNEEQRVDNAGYIMSWTIGMYFLAAILIGIITVFIYRKQN